MFTPRRARGGRLWCWFPVIGAVGVAFLVKNFTEAKGHGVPEVMDAIYYGGAEDSSGGRLGEVTRIGLRLAAGVGRA